MVTIACMSLDTCIRQYRLVKFTDDDDNHLCHYLAIVVPVKEDGGRTGYKIYQNLRDLV